MRVLKEGDVGRSRKLRDKKYKTTCPYCGSVLEFRSEEIEYSLIEGDTSYYITCPLCKYCFKVNMKPYIIPNMAEIEEVTE